MLRTAHNPLPSAETTVASLSPGPREKREALEELLQSTTFVRADQLRNFLRYVCEMEMAGRASELCEFRIGIEAFGRPADYSPIEDGIVRRRAVSLREKLQEVYATDLAEARIRIELPKGRYVPRFVRVEPGSAIEVVPSSVIPMEHVVEPPLSEAIARPVLVGPTAKILWFAVGLAIGALVCAALFLALRSQPRSTPQASAAAPGVSTADVASAATTTARPSVEPGVIYQAAAKSNTLSGRTTVAACSWCSGGNRVRYIGGKPRNYVVINDIIVSQSGNYEMAIYYVLDGSRTFFISVNEGPYIEVPLKGKNWLESSRFSMTVSLKAGSNHIKFSGGSYAPDLDHIVIR